MVYPIPLHNPYTGWQAYLLDSDKSHKFNPGYENNGVAIGKSSVCILRVRSANDDSDTPQRTGGGPGLSSCMQLFGNMNRPRP